MTATQMLVAGLNAALRRPIVNAVLRRPIKSGSVLRKGLIVRGVIKPAGRWEYVPSPNGSRREAKLVWITTATS